MGNWNWEKIAKYSYRVLGGLLLAAIFCLLVGCTCVVLLLSFVVINNSIKMHFSAGNIIATLTWFAYICADILFAKYIISVLKKEIVKTEDFLVTISFAYLLYIFFVFVGITILPEANSANPAISAIFTMLFFGFLKLSSYNNS